MAEYSFPPAAPLVPIMAIVSRGADKIIQIIAVATAEVGTVAGTYLGPNGPTNNIAEASPIEGPAGESTVSLVGTGNLAQSAAIAIAAGIRAVPVAVAGVVPGQAYSAVATGAVPAGYALHDCFCTVAGTLNVNVSAPLLAIGANYSIPVKVFKLS